MQVETRDRGKSEQNVLTGMIVNDVVAAAVAAKWPDEGMFQSRVSNLLGRWTVDYYRRYRRAPGPAIEQIYDKWANSGRQDRDTVELLNKFLRSLSSRYAALRKALNPAFVIDQAAEHFTAVRCRALRDALDTALASGDWEQADKIAKEYRAVEMGSEAMVRPFRDMDAVDAAFSEDFKTDLIVLPGAAGKFFRHIFARDCFVALEGMAKVGKSFWLMFFVFMALLQKRRVAFFETGDMSQHQIMRRFASLAAKRPIFGDREHPVKIPVSIDPMPGGDPPVVQYRDQMYPEDLTADLAKTALSRFGKTHGDDLLRLSVHRNRSISMLQIEAKIDEWVAAGWGAPDIIAVDYLDLLKPINGRTETRDEINETWQAGRAMSQKFHCCLLGPTQSDTASYNAAVMKRENFSGDRRKNDHVTAMIGLNQQQRERDAGVYRLNFVHGRDVDFSTELWCACCLALSNPCVLTTC